MARLTERILRSILFKLYHKPVGMQRRFSFLYKGMQPELPKFETSDKIKFNT